MLVAVLTFVFCLVPPSFAQSHSDLLWLPWLYSSLFPDLPCWSRSPQSVCFIHQPLCSSASSPAANFWSLSLVAHWLPLLLSIVLSACQWRLPLWVLVLSGWLASASLLQPLLAFVSILLFLPSVVLVQQSKGDSQNISNLDIGCWEMFEIRNASRHNGFCSPQLSYSVESKNHIWRATPLIALIGSVPTMSSSFLFFPTAGHLCDHIEMLVGSFLIPPALLNILFLHCDNPVVLA